MSVLEDVQIADSNRHAVRVTNLSANGTPLTNTQVNGRISGNQINDSGGSGLYVEDTGNSVTDWQLKDNYFAVTGANGIEMDNAAGWMITGNHIYGVGGDVALNADRLFGSSISDNYIEDFGATGVLVRAQGDAASTIANNRIFKFNDGAGTFLHVEGRYGTPNVAVTGNTIRGNGTGIGLDYQKGDADGLVVTSTGNLVSDVSTQRQVGDGVTLDAGMRTAEEGPDTW
jgi:putative cofactor-binding repeat protein